LEETLWRIDLQSGQAAALVSEITASYSKSGWLAYDPWRDGVLAYFAWQPVAAFLPRLWLLRAGENPVDLGFASQSELITDLAPVGDGRVYLRRGGELHLLDAANALHPVLDALGQPGTNQVEHLIYHAPTNSLIGSVSTQIANPCSGFHVLTLHRLPLTPDGTALPGPPVCTSYFFDSAGFPMGFDELPDGGLLLIVANNGSPQADELLRVDPFTLAATSWADPVGGSLDGGPYPLFGGTGYLLPPIVVTLTLPLGGTAGSQGAGWAMATLPVPGDPALLGLSVFAQAGVLDAAAVQGVALTKALELVFG
jgi:hypothetical protein